MSSSRISFICAFTCTTTLGLGPAHAVHNGTVDTTNQFEASVSINRGCSGTLVTPFWVLTAAHCFDEPGQELNEVFLWFGDEDAPSSSAQHRVVEGQPISGPIILMSTSTTDVGYDLALIRLDTPVALAEAVPLNPSLSVGSCGGSQFDSFLVGYGDTLITQPGDFPLAPASMIYGLAAPSCGSTPAFAPFKAKRNFTLTGGWDRGNASHSGLPQSEYFRATWDVWAGCPNADGWCASYEGSVNGDSGGTLIRASDGQLCGVNKGKKKPFVPYALYPSLLTV